MKRVYTSRGTPTTEAGILTRRREPGLRQLRRPAAGRLHRPAALLQAADPADLARRRSIMAAGGALSLTDRRFRVGAPVRARPAVGRGAGGVGRWAVRDDQPSPARLRRAIVSLARVLLRSGLARPRRPARRASCPIPRSSAAPATSPAGLRCLVCQNQSIDDSDAPLAKDLRVLVRERLKAGDGDRAGARLRRQPLRRVRAAAPRARTAHRAALADAAPRAGRRRRRARRRDAPTPARRQAVPAALAPRRTAALDGDARSGAGEAVEPTLRRIHATVSAP